MMIKKVIVFFIFFLLFFSVYSDIRLPSILGSNMVLQQKSSAKLWGWSSPNEPIKITTSWDNKIIETLADGNASWQVEVQTPEAGGPYSIIFQGSNEIVLEDILIGEVWVCSGQSNMEWSYNNGVSSIKEEFTQLGELDIRLFDIPSSTSKTPQDNSGGNWTVCDSNTLKSFSAIGYYYAKYLKKKIKVPVGLIGSNWGGTPAEVWTPKELVEKDELLRVASEKNTPVAWWPVAPGYAYNSMIYPIINYNIAGVIWYQGESNTATFSSYTKLMDKMINSWRQAWNNKFPFYYVQIAPYRYRNNNIGALLREAQSKSLYLEKTGMVVISDLVKDTLDIHPTNKKDVAFRLADLALVETYGIEKKDYKSPSFKSFSINGRSVVIDFDNLENGLVVRGEEAKEIFIAGADKVFYSAIAKIDGNKLEVSSKRVKTPVAVRYAFSNAGIGNIFSKAGLPVAPFRTDGWEVDISEAK